MRVKVRVRVRVGVRVRGLARVRDAASHVGLVDAVLVVVAADAGALSLHLGTELEAGDEDVAAGETEVPARPIIPTGRAKVEREQPHHLRRLQIDGARYLEMLSIATRHACAGAATGGGGQVVARWGGAGRGGCRARRGGGGVWRVQRVTVGTRTVVLGQAVARVELVKLGTHVQEATALKPVHVAVGLVDELTEDAELGVALQRLVLN